MTSSAIITDQRDEIQHNGKCNCLCCVVYSVKAFIHPSSGWGYYVLMLIATCRYSHWPLKQLSTFHEYLCVGIQYTNSACSHIKPIPRINASTLTQCTSDVMWSVSISDRRHRKATLLQQSAP